MSPIFDEAGRAVAPPQSWPDPRPSGPWDANGGPYATFAFDQPDFEGGSFPVYTIHGGLHDGSSVTAETLRELGIPIVKS